MLNWFYAYGEHKRRQANLRRLLNYFAIAIYFVLLVVPRELSAQQSGQIGTTSVYMEPSLEIVESDVRFPALISHGDKLFLFFQKISGSENARSMSISYIMSDDGRDWSSESAIVDQIALESDLVPPVFSAASSNSRLLVAVAPSQNEVEIYGLASDSQAEFLRQGRVKSPEDIIVNPQLFAAGNSFVLFVSKRSEAVDQSSLLKRESFNIMYSSRVGDRWRELRLLPVMEDQEQVFNPWLLDTGQRQILAYESRTFEENSRRISRVKSQISLMVSNDGGLNWEDSRNISDFVDIGDESNSSIDSGMYQNHNPRLFIGKDGLPLVLYERNLPGFNARISLSRLDANGNLVDVRRRNIPQSSWIRNIYLSPRARASGAADFFVHGDTEYAMYFYDPQGSSEVFLVREGRVFEPDNWQSYLISSDDMISVFSEITIHRRRPHFVWLTRPAVGNSVSTLVYRQPDQYSMVPQVTPLSFRSGEASNRRDVQFRISSPVDTSGIRELFVAWGPENGVGPEDLRSVGGKKEFVFEANRHGRWTLLTRSLDAAGNYSAIQTTAYELDLNPPKAVNINPPPVDQGGFLESNSLEISWSESPEHDISGYEAELLYLGGSLEQLDDEQINAGILARMDVSQARVQESPSFVLHNVDNGLWAFAVRPVDRVGNRGEIRIRLLRANKYIPVTLLNFISSEETAEGELGLRFSGKGYLADGVVQRIVLDEDGQEPWDYEFALSDGDYKIQSDRIISDIFLRNYDAGDYRIGIFHSSRGWYFHSKLLSLDVSGAVKFGDYTVYDPPDFRVLGARRFNLSAWNVASIIVVPLMVLMVVITIFRIRSVVADNRALQMEVGLLLQEGRLPPEDKAEEIRFQIQQRGMGLRTKFTLYMLVLVIAVVSLVAFPLSRFTLNNQQATLARGLENRIQVIIRSLANGASSVLQTRNSGTIIQGLASLLTQSSSMQEIDYLTITSIPNPVAADLNQESREYIWISNDPLLFGDEEKRQQYISSVPAELRNSAYFRRQIDGEADFLDPGRFIIQDNISDSLSDYGSELNNEIARMALNQTPEELGSRIDQMLEIKSAPQFSVENYDTRSRYYSFYFPIIWVDQESPELSRFQGAIRLGITTERINQRIGVTQRIILLRIAAFAGVAILAGIIIALVLAGITVNPVKRLVAAVEKIRETEKKEDLADQPIELDTGDELQYLAETINTMTDGLIKAEKSNKSVLLGKDVQKMFISLDPNPQDDKTKATTLHFTDSDHIEIFGYYEGAKGVSGDYYYLQRIDPETFAMIKCDVSGKDIEASLIMVTVATLFLKHFDNWQQRQIEQKKIARALGRGGKQPVLSELATTINEIIYAREFSGKFAAFNMITLNERSGAINFCNAGDNVLHVYRRRQRKVVEQHLARTPAAGAVSEKVMGMPISFPEEPGQLEPGDILLFFTDGYEEARRYIRHPDWSVYKESEYDGESGKRRLEELEAELSPFILGQDEGGLGEAFSIPRIHDVVEAVMNRREYFLSKFRNPLDEELSFDFTRLETSLPNLILALMSVEKVFRLVPRPDLTSENRIQVDKKVDAFLREYFMQYPAYFHHPLPENGRSLYRRYSHIMEDSQYDDLTFLAIEKKQEIVGE